MTEQDKTRLKGLSKAAAVIALIIKICLLVAVPCIIIVMVALPIAFKDVTITENEIAYKNIASLKIDDTRTKIDVIYEGDVIHTEENAQSLVKLIEMFDENTSDYMVKYIDCKLGISFVSLIIAIVIITKIRKILNNIHDEDTPFTEENVDLLKRITFLSIVDIVMPLIMGIILSLALNMNLSINLGTSSIMEILIVGCLVYVFKYGVVLQGKSKEKIYD